MSRKDNELYEFGEFRLDVAEHRLTRIDDVPVGPVPEKAFQTLVHLIRNSGSLVTKKELLETVWPDAIVEENNLDKAIHTLRQALGERNGNQKYIETVRKHGYRFLVPVRELSTPRRRHAQLNGRFEPGTVQILAKPQITASGQHVMFDIAADGTSSLEPETIQVALAGNSIAGPARAQKRSSKWLLLLVLAVALIGVAMIALYRYGSSGSDSEKHSLLVLPVASVGPVRDELLEVGLADSLIHQLSPGTSLIVRPLSATRLYSAETVDPLAAGKEQKVDYVLASSYQIAEGRVRITARLINIRTGEVDEPFKVETAANAAFAMQDALTSELSSKIVSHLGGTVGPLRKRGTSNEDAYRHYLQGMSLLDQRRGGDSEQSFGKAVALDPNFALAWAGKALAHRNIAIGDVDARLHYELTVEAANRAIALDPTIPEAYSALCLNKLQYEYDASSAEPLCKRAIEIDPRSSIAHNSYSWVLNYQQRHDEAVEEIKIAIDLEPRSFINQRMYANTLYLARHHEAAKSQYERLVQLNPNVVPTYEWSILNLQALGKFSEAYEWFIRSLRASKTDEATIQIYQKVYEQSGWNGVLRERLVRTDEPNNLRRAGSHASLGNKDAAFEVLNKMFDSRRALLPLIRSDAQFDLLRDDPRYHDLVRRINLK